MTSIVDASHYLFTSESVTEGHPDKMCDQISDAILDAIIRDDPNARVACETATTTGLVLVLGEITYKIRTYLIARTLINAGLGVVLAVGLWALKVHFAFILGIWPLVNATGAGAASRRSLGTAVFGGMIAATVLAVFFVPVFYVLVQRASEWRRRPGAKQAAVSDDTDATDMHSPSLVGAAQSMPG